MSTWNEHHYARAAEFVRLLGDALGTASKSAPIAAAPATPPPNALTLSPPPSNPARPTAASVFKSIPWKK